MNDAAKNDVLTADVTNGLLADAYRLANINTNANHAPCVAPIAQHALDDAVYVCLLFLYLHCDKTKTIDSSVTADGQASSVSVIDKKREYYFVSTDFFSSRAVVILVPTTA